ncbi:MAG: DMT family transporter [Chloroflexota bacterium]|nr:DMT family transporter [Chloroflexota bacterium]
MAAANRLAAERAATASGDLDGRATDTAGSTGAGLLAAYAMLVGASVGWGVSAPLVKFSVIDLPPLTAACLRFGLGGVLMVGILWARGELRRPARHTLGLLLVLGLLGVALFGSLYTIGLQFTGAAEGVLIQGIAPLVTMGLAALLLGERLQRAQLGGVAIAFVGLAVLATGGSAAGGAGDARLLGNALMVASAVAWGAYSVAVRMVMGRLTLIETSAYSVLVGALLLAPFTLLESARVPLAEVRAATWLAIGYQIVVSSCLCYLLWNGGIRRAGAGRAAPFAFVSPVAAALAAIPILGEIPGPAQLVGGALILLGLFVATGRGRP